MCRGTAPANSTINPYVLTTIRVENASVYEQIHDDVYIRLYCKKNDLLLRKEAKEIFKIWAIRNLNAEPTRSSV
jgi:hypothetical protein